MYLNALKKVVVASNVNDLFLNMTNIKVITNTI